MFYAYSRCVLENICFVVAIGHGSDVLQLYGRFVPEYRRVHTWVLTYTLYMESYRRSLPRPAFNFRIRPGSEGLGVFGKSAKGCTTFYMVPGYVFYTYLDSGYACTIEKRVTRTRLGRHNAVHADEDSGKLCG